MGITPYTNMRCWRNAPKGRQVAEQGETEFLESDAADTLQVKTNSFSAETNTKRFVGFLHFYLSNTKHNETSAEIRNRAKIQYLGLVFLTWVSSDVMVL